MKKTPLYFLIFVLLGCFEVKLPASNAEKISHDDWDALLKKYVSDAGVVDYGGFKKDEILLDTYLNKLSESSPSAKWSQKESLAYLINAYNAFTIKLILDHIEEDIKSIKDIGSKIMIPFVNSPWDIRFININGKKMDLNNIEHGIIRKKYKEPRIHFALVCAAVSCPRLRNEAFVANKLDQQLDEQAVSFLNDPVKNKIDGDKVSLSKIFKWYGGDFKDLMPLIDWVNKYSKTKISDKASIDYLDYIWDLNGTY